MDIVGIADNVDDRLGQGHRSYFQACRIHVVFNRCQAQGLPGNQRTRTVGQLQIQTGHFRGAAEGACERLLLPIQIKVAVNAQRAAGNGEVGAFLNVGLKGGQSDAVSGDGGFQGKRCRCQLAVQ